MGVLADEEVLWENRVKVDHVDGFEDLYLPFPFEECLDSVTLFVLFISVCYA